MNIQALHPAPAQTTSERYYPTAPEVQNNAVNAVIDKDEAPGITAVQGKSSGAGENGIQGELLDRFAPEEPTGRAGLYRKAKDQDGNPTLRFDDPAKAKKEAEEASLAEKAAEEEKAAKEKAAEEKEAEKAEARTTTINTDRVDREIRELREKIEDVSQELRTATGEQAEKLEQQLLQDKIALRIKDNDTYRRAHSQVSVE